MTGACWPPNPSTFGAGDLFRVGDGIELIAETVGVVSPGRAEYGGKKRCTQA